MRSSKPSTGFLQYCCSPSIDRPQSAARNPRVISRWAAGRVAQDAKCLILKLFFVWLKLALSGYDDRERGEG